MNSNTAQAWSQEDTFPSASIGAQDDDFSHFFDLDNIDLGIAPGNEENFDTQNFQSSTSTNLAQANNASPFPQFVQYGDAPGGSVSGPQGYTSNAGHSHNYPFGQFSQNGSDQTWTGNDQFRPHFSVPPTPTSSEMYPSQFLHQQTSHPSYHTHQFRKDDPMVSFTPLVSPQVGSADPSLSMPSFGPQEPYNLSPLNSPAIDPQIDSTTSLHGSSSVQSLATISSNTGSPMDYALDAMPAQASAGIDSRPRKQRRKTPNSTPSNTSTRAKQAQPATGRKRKETVTKSTRGRSKAATNAASSTSTRSRTQQAEVSALVTPHENVMGPPSKPASAKTTPTIAAQSNSTTPSNPPVTPAGLMRLASNQSSGSLDPQTGGARNSDSPAADGLGNSMEELKLPEAATITETQTEPRSNVLASHGAKSAPRAPSKSSSACPSAVMSPTEGGRPDTPADGIKNQPSGLRARKRNSTSSSAISPAIRPKISPGIKPLLPDGSRGALNDDAHALLLASKSNYQNLLEGNHIPGVNYPSGLSKTLTSKRTSHKIAEQGRRNRINTALQEMQSLLPAAATAERLGLPITGTSENSVGGSGSVSGDVEAGPSENQQPTTTNPLPNPANQTNNSKAATVELAIDHIKLLTTRLAYKEDENERLKTELESLRRRHGVDVSVRVSSEE